MFPFVTKQNKKEERKGSLFRYSKLSFYFSDNVVTASLQTILPFTRVRLSPFHLGFTPLVNKTKRPFQDQRWTTGPHERLLQEGNESFHTKNLLFIIPERVNLDGEGDSSMDRDPFRHSETSETWSQRVLKHTVTLIVQEIGL